MRYYEITVSTCTFADWARIVQKAVQQALRGDAVARKFLADYLVGTPEQNINITGYPSVSEVVAELPESGGDD